MAAPFFFYLFLLSPCTCVLALLGSHRTMFYMFFCSTKERDEFSLLCMNFFVLLPPSSFKFYMFFSPAKERDEFSLLYMNYFCSAAAQHVRNLNLSHSEHDTIDCHRFKHW
jgi:hypothetical protein